jgi:hypothetical protein
MEMSERMPINCVCARPGGTERTRRERGLLCHRPEYQRKSPCRCACHVEGALTWDAECRLVVVPYGVSSTLESYFGRAWEVARFDPAASLQSILDRAMWDHLDHITLAPGEGAEARRLLAMVAWNRVPQARWPDVFESLRMAAAARAVGLSRWEDALREMLAEGGWLVGEAERSAA